MHSAPSPYRVAKFGGTSVQDHRAITCVADIVEEDPRHLVVVLSAMAKVTDLLLGAANAAILGLPFQTEQDAFRERHHSATDALLKDAARKARLHQQIDHAADELGMICQSLSILREGTQRMFDMTASRGERLLASLFTELMQERGHDAVYLDATKLIQVEKQHGTFFPSLDKTTKNVEAHLLPLLERGCLVVVPGFIGSGPEGELVTLGRGGSDLSATVLAHCLHAPSVTLYKEVDGLLTADPRHVKEARIVPEMHYREAAELAYYGAKVLHPRTIIPLLHHQIPLTVRSTFNTSLPGTRIAGDVQPGSFPVKALTAILDQSLVAIEGKGMLGVPGIAARTFSALAQAGISVSVISQASSEANICLVVPTIEAKLAVNTLREALQFELEHKLIDDIKSREGQAVLAIVGLGMQGTPGIAARTFAALARAEANVEAIAQGSTELNISVVIPGVKVGAALVSLHREFRLEKLQALAHSHGGEVEVAVFGVGQIGRTLLTQIAGQQDYFHHKMQLDLGCIALMDRSGLVVSDKPFSPKDLQSIALTKQHGGSLQHGPQLSIQKLHTELKTRLWQRPVRKGIFVDSTAEDSASVIKAALTAGWNVALANKKPLAVKQAEFDELFQIAKDNFVQLRYEATVGAGLPILDTLAKLKEAGDEVASIEGCFSGTLGYLMTELEQGVSFSDAVRRAHALGYTEPDPREDLNGMDVTRKALILARTLGIRLNLEDIKTEALYPASMAQLDQASFLSQTSELDQVWLQKCAMAKEAGMALRYVARIDREAVTVGVAQMPLNSPLGRLRGTDNQVIIRTRRYAEHPLVVSGPGAGAEVTAAGVLNDILAIAVTEDLGRRAPTTKR